MFLSIIVPVYNAESYLAELLESVVSQSYKKIELVIVNDGSTDSSRRIAECFSNKYDFIRVVNTENRGVAQARVTGFVNSRGDYVMFVDSDDILPEFAVESFLRIAQSSQADVIVSDYNKLYRNLTIPCSSSILNEGQFVFSPVSLLKNDVSCSMWAKLFKRSVISEIDLLSGSSFSIGEDLLVNLAISKKSLNAFYVKTSLYTYRMRSSSLTALKKVGLDAFVNFRKSVRALLDTNNDDSELLMLLDLGDGEGVLDILSPGLCLELVELSRVVDYVKSREIKMKMRYGFKKLLFVLMLKLRAPVFFIRFVYLFLYFIFGFIRKGRLYP